MKWDGAIKNFMNDVLFPVTACKLCGKEYGSSNIEVDASLYQKEALLVRNRLMKLVDICVDCKAKLEIPTLPTCKNCHKPMEHSEWLLCSDCEGSEIAITNRSALVYNDIARESLALYKYRGKESLAAVFGRMITIVFEEYYSHEEIDFITYIPLHLNRLEERGFNQAEQLAWNVHQYTGIQLLSTLVRWKETEKQSKSSRETRIKQLDQSFDIIEDIREAIKERNILLVDDIYTTGATIREATKLLNDAGARNVYGLTLARAISEIKT